MGQNNLLDVKLFTPSLAACRDHCERTTECRSAQWWWGGEDNSQLFQVLLLVPDILQLRPSLLLHVQTVRHQGEDSFAEKQNIENDKYFLRTMSPQLLW